MSSPALQSPYPATTKQAAGIAGGLLTDVMVTSFADRIVVTITQEGRLAQWMHVALENARPALAEHSLLASSGQTDFLPLTHLTAKTLLGGSISERETMGQLYATQIASAIVTKNPEEKRSMALGLGLSKMEASRDFFLDIIDLAMRAI